MAQSQAFLALLLVLGSSFIACTLGASRPSGCKTDYDVCVIGAGGSGAFAAVKLKQQGLRVLVLEKDSKVGGHCKAWMDPSDPSGHIDIGVIVYFDDPVVTDTLTEFGIPLVHLSPDMSKPTLLMKAESSYGAKYLGGQMVDYSGLAALGPWLGILQERYSSMDTPNGAMPDFDKLPAEVVAEMQAPFSELLKKLSEQHGDVDLYGLMKLFGSIVPSGGTGPLLDMPALWALHTLGPAVVGILSGQGYAVPGGCQVLYDKFHQVLGTDVKLGVKWTAIKRHSDYVQVTWKNANGVTVKGRTCRRLVVAAPKDLASLRSFIKDLDSREVAVFGKVTYGIYGSAIVRSPPAAKAPTGAVVNLVDVTPSQLPTTTGITTYPNMDGGVGQVWTLDMTPASTMQGTVDMLWANLTQWSREVGGVFEVPERKEQLVVDGPYLHKYLPRPRDDVPLADFYRDLYALQGHRNTYYAGALLTYDSQMHVWKYSKWLVNTTKWTC